MKLALSMLCENPRRKTGLTTLFHEFVRWSLRLYPDLSWVIFLGPDQEWPLDDPRVTLDRRFPANDRLGPRLLADHFRVPLAARRHGAQALVTVGFTPALKTLPTAMHVLSLQHLDPSNRLGLAREWYRRWLTRFSWPRADLLIVNSRFAASQLLSVQPQHRARLIQSYEGLQHDQFHPHAPPDEAARVRTQFNVPPGYILWVSNFYPYKQAELLLDAYARLSPAFRQAHPLLMVGGDWENQVARAKEQTVRLGIAQDVHFAHWVADEWLAPLYRHALAFCLASREETFGRCVLESMACGTPCVVHDIPVMHEVTAGAAVVLDYRDAAAVARTLQNLAEQPGERDRLRQLGLARAAEFSFERLARERIEAVKKLVN